MPNIGHGGRGVHMNKLRRIVFNVALYITIVGIIAIVLFLMILFVMKLNVSALSGGSDKPICVVIDPGHGGEDGGAVSESGIVEKNINLSISMCLKDYFEMSGIDVIMTRADDRLLGEGSTVGEKLHNDFPKRLELYNSSDADFVVSIHQNKFTSPEEHGAQVFYGPADIGSERLARCIKRSLNGLLQPDNEREITKAGSNIYLLNNCANPCVLVECGFLSNPKEAQQLDTYEYQRQMAFSIYCGAMEYISNSKADTASPAKNSLHVITDH